MGAGYSTFWSTEQRIDGRIYTTKGRTTYAIFQILTICLDSAQPHGARPYVTPTLSIPHMAVQPPAWEDMLNRVQALGVPFGREQSFKLTPAQLLSDRLLIGVQRSALPVPALMQIAGELGMPQDGRTLLVRALPLANAVFFATEDTPQHRLYKIYLEFWDAVRARVRAGDASPQLLHFGVKWSSARPGHCEQARYVCHPLLGVRAIQRRMRAVYPAPDSALALELALQMVGQAAARAPDAAFLYLEASEANNPRRSFDINLYKSGLRVQDVQGPLQQAAERFGIAPQPWQAQLASLGPLALGHLSGGCDRRGEEFLSVYAEIAPLPEPG